MVLGIIGIFALVNYANSGQYRIIFANKTESRNPSLSEALNTTEGLKSIIGSYYSKYGKILYDLANCESGFKDICIVDTNGKLSCGIFMYQKSTFNHFCKGNWLNPLDQLKCADNMIHNGRLKLDWVNCSKKILIN